MWNGCTSINSSWFYDFLCKAKCALSRNSRPSPTDLCILFHSVHDCRAVANVFETFRDDQLAWLTVPSDASTLKLFCSEYGRLVLRPCYSFKFARMSLLCGCNLKRNALAWWFCSSFWGPNFAFKKLWWSSEKDLYRRGGTSACYIV